MQLDSDKAFDIGVRYGYGLSSVTKVLLVDMNRQITGTESERNQYFQILFKLNIYK